MRWPRRQPERAAPPIDSVAAVAERLAVLLAAGVAPHNAWGYLGAGEDARGPAGQILEAAARASSHGEDVSGAIALEARQVGGQVGDAWLALAGAWAVATRAGAPLAACLRALASTFREVGELHRSLDVALAGPAATARMVMALPVVGILFGTLMGFDSARTLFLTIPGLICLVLGACLMTLGHLWNRRLLTRARVRDPAPGLELDLMAVAMAGGGSIDRARTLVRDALDGVRVGTEDTQVDAVLELSRRAGVPAGQLLRSEAEQLRRAARGLGERRAATLAVTLMLPLGLCVLPAFMLVGVVPLLLTVLSSTLHTF